MNKLRRTLMAGIAATGALLGSQALAQEITLKLHQFLPQQANVPKLVLDEWIKRIEEGTNGKVKIEHYPSMQLGGKPPELMDQVQDGIVDLAWTVNGFTPGRFPRSEVFELPFIMTNAEATSRAYWELFEKEMKDTDYKDVHIIGAWVHGPGMMHTNKPVNTMEDMKGMKFRIPSRMAGFLLENLGAVPVGMPVTAIPEALSKGVIDGAVIPWEVTTALKVPELVHNHTEFADGYAFYTITFTLAMNKDKYDSLPDDVKAVFDANSGLEFSAFAGAQQAGADGPARQKAQDAGNTIITISAEDSEKWKAFAQPVYERWVADVTAKGVDGAALLAEAQALIAKYTAAQ
ncbi:TRAP transporter substrate-binding protein [Thalassobius vesicularis]|uniref:TRAP transporter substrate-binding protein n=1 Tax=Thalassobius vesicularis TaxID=1294297 RepID=A0A4S3M4X6_9RHOB|nr:TRAP transporter substrate-binding protein [Thalassobius vesicularis]THD71582.1 TRAP transporter substrate-binding protein [Thalassobius vesicularis]